MRSESARTDSSVQHAEHASAVSNISSGVCGLPCWIAALVVISAEASASCCAGPRLEEVFENERAQVRKQGSPLQTQALTCSFL